MSSASEDTKPDYTPIDFQAQLAKDLESFKEVGTASVTELSNVFSKYLNFFVTMMSFQAEELSFLREIESNIRNSTVTQENTERLLNSLEVMRAKLTATTQGKQ